LPTCPSTLVLSLYFIFHVEMLNPRGVLIRLMLPSPNSGGRQAVITGDDWILLYKLSRRSFKGCFSVRLDFSYHNTPKIDFFNKKWLICTKGGRKIAVPSARWLVLRGFSLLGAPFTRRWPPALSHPLRQAVGFRDIT